MWKLFLSRVNKCTVTIIIIIIYVKNFLNYLCRDFNKHFAKINLLLWKKLYTISLMHCKARPILGDLLRTNHKEMSQKWYVWQKLLNSTSKIWKPSYDWRIWFSQQSEGINHIVIEDLNIWQITAVAALK